MRIGSIILVIALGSAPALGQQDFPTELEDCTGPGASFCFDGVPALLDSECGSRFEGYDGRIAWPVLRNLGPVTIAIQTRYRFDARPGQEQPIMPLYVEVCRRGSELDRLECRTGFGGVLVLIAQGAEQCGGTWESVGPIDLARYGVPLGDPYNVQCAFFRHGPEPRTPRSVGFSCIRVTSSTPVSKATWGIVKSLYTDATK